MGTDDKRTASVILMDFFNMLPLRELTNVSSTLTEIRNSLNDVIPNTNPIASFLCKVKQLQLVFMKISIVLRKQMKSILLEGLEASLEISNSLLCIFTLCLCLLELSALRNCDRSDLESEDIWTTIQMLNSSILPKLCEKIKQQKTNLPSLLSWSYCMLEFSYYACTEWIYSQGCKPSLSFDIHNSVVLDEIILDHPTVPVIMRHVLYAQIRNKPYLTPPTSRTLLDLMFSSAVSSNAGILNSCKCQKTYGSYDCSLEFDEPPVQPIKVERKINPVLTDSLHELPSDFQDNLQTGSFETILLNLSALKQLWTSDLQDSLLEPLVFTLRQSPFILKRLRSCLVNNQKPDETNVQFYEQIYTILLQLWFQAATNRILLKNFPQSYIWLCGFTCPMYEVMSINGFHNAVLWTGRFLTAYENLFRISIVNSAHWYLQMITDAVIAVIDRSGKDNQQEMSSDELNEVLCSCMAAIVRPFHALRIEDQEVYAEMSRAIKVPLESIVSHLSGCSVTRESVSTNPKAKKAKTKKLTSTPTITSRLRDFIVHHLILPMIRSCDKWALGQAKMGIKPHCAKALLNQLITVAEVQNSDLESLHIAQKLDIFRPSAVGGLHVTEKLSLKRKR
ncbi:hypothetical protein KSF78_0003461 [Schistosoma japonicum]|nr:hypothetical protein KSF78_0003461 [Schistosoma japonicum]